MSVERGGGASRCGGENEKDEEKVRPQEHIHWIPGSYVWKELPSKHPCSFCFLRVGRLLGFGGTKTRQVFELK